MLQLYFIIKYEKSKPFIHTRKRKNLILQFSIVGFSTVVFGRFQKRFFSAGRKKKQIFLVHFVDKFKYLSVN